jgi:hypothetical protein
MNPTATQSPTGITFVVRFWQEWSGAESRWRGRIEHVESGRHANFLEFEDLLAFLRRFSIHGTHPSPAAAEDNQVSQVGEASGGETL